MSKRICGRCKSTNIEENGLKGEVVWCNCKDCKYFSVVRDFPKETLFHRITRSPEELAKYLVYGDILFPQKEVVFRSTLTVGYWRKAKEAYDETLKILKSSEPPKEYIIARFGDWDKEVYDV